jgi:hypothetical protein
MMTEYPISSSTHEIEFEKKGVLKVPQKPIT